MLAQDFLLLQLDLLLFLDDMQWCDPDSFEWLNALLTSSAATGILLVGTVRAEEILAGHPLVAFLGALQRDGMVTEITLGPLATTEKTNTQPVALIQ